MKIAFVCFNGMERNGEYTFLKHLNSSLPFDTIVFDNKITAKSELKGYFINKGMKTELDKLYVIKNFEKLIELINVQEKYDVIIINNGFLNFENANYDFLSKVNAKIGYVCHGVHNEEYYNFENMQNYLDFMLVFSNVQYTRYNAKQLVAYPIVLPFNEIKYAKHMKQPNKEKKIVSVVTRMSRFKKVNEVIDMWLRHDLPHTLRLFKGDSGRAWNEQIVPFTGKSIKDTVDGDKCKNIEVWDEYANVQDVYESSDLVIDNSFVEDDDGRVQYTVIEAFAHRVPILVNKDWSKELNTQLSIYPLEIAHIELLLNDEEEKNYYKNSMETLMLIHDSKNVAKRILDICNTEVYK